MLQNPGDDTDAPVKNGRRRAAQRPAALCTTAPAERAFAPPPSSYADAPRLVAPGAAMLRLETATEGTRIALRPREPALLVALPGSCEIAIDGAPARIADRETFVVAPARSRIEARVVSPTARLAMIEIGSSVRARVVEEYTFERLDATALARLLRTAMVLPRTTWVGELVHRYVFERAICGKHASLAATFLEVELVKEVYFLAIEREDARERAPGVALPNDVAARAVEVIERDLFGRLSIRELARRSGASPRTLLRAFHRALGLGPAEYIRHRRLDEARALLRSGRYRVGEVATRIGYASVPAFSTAFARRFGVAPSRLGSVDDALRRPT
jgi:AraC-like DNA-binding protein